MSDTKGDAIGDILKVRDQLVVMRERLFQLTAATAARTKKVDGLLMDCAAAGRVFGARIGLPEWDNVLAMPGRQYIPSLDAELQLEMGRLCKNFNWKSPELLFDRFNNDMIRTGSLLSACAAGLDERMHPIGISASRRSSTIWRRVRLGAGRRQTVFWSATFMSRLWA